MTTTSMRNSPAVREGCVLPAPRGDEDSSTSVLAPADLVEQVEQLTRGLVTRTVIGQAQGILIERYKVTADEAFRLLVWASQHSNLKLRDIAAELVLTGELVGLPQHGRLGVNGESTSCASATCPQSEPLAPSRSAVG